MTHKQSADYLAELVCDYIDNLYPLEYLTGMGERGRPDKRHIRRLAEALEALDYPDFDERARQLRALLK